MTFPIVGVVPIIHGVAPSFTFLHHNHSLFLLCQMICFRCKNCTWLEREWTLNQFAPSASQDSRGIQPIVTSSTAQQFGDSRRLIRFFCQSCCSMHDEVELAPMPPCPVPLECGTTYGASTRTPAPSWLSLLILPLSTCMLTAFTTTELQEVIANRVNTVNTAPQYSGNYIEKPLMHVWRGNIQPWE